MKLKGATLIAKIAMALATQTLQQIVGTQIVSLQQAQQSIVKEMYFDWVTKKLGFLCLCFLITISSTTHIKMRIIRRLKLVCPISCKYEVNLSVMRHFRLN